MATSSKKKPTRVAAQTLAKESNQSAHVHQTNDSPEVSAATVAPVDAVESGLEAVEAVEAVETPAGDTPVDTVDTVEATPIAAPETRELPAIVNTRKITDAADTTAAYVPGAASIEDESTLFTGDPQLEAQQAQDKQEDEVAPRATLTSRPKKTTLAMAFTKSSSAPKSPVPAETPASQIEDEPTLFADMLPDEVPESALEPSGYSYLPPVGPVFTGGIEAKAGGSDAVPADVADEVDEWSIADQPTVYLPPKSKLRPRPSYLDDDHLPLRPPASTFPTPRPVQRPPQTPQSLPARPRPQPPVNPSPTPRYELPGRPLPPPSGRRLAAPDGRPMPGTPPAGVPRAALPDPRMERFQNLRLERLAHEEGKRGPEEPQPVAEKMRQWWRDLRPNLNNALNYQREARASGAHPIPAYEESTAGSRLGDAFGRLAASAREMTERAQNAIAPRFNRLQELHDHAENATSALVEKLEGPPARQQAPLLGPGRIAVFFKQGVTIGQAQALLGASHARPIRLIPRKHGFLALVPPGAESEISERLRVHAYVRDVAYLDYDEYGEPIVPH